jgi:hypothetical protein
MTYGGNEEIVLKGAKEQKHLRQVKMVLFRERMYMPTFIWYSLPNTDSYRRLNGNMLLLLMLVKENIIFTKVKRNILGQEVIRVLAKTVTGDQLANFKQGNGDYGGIAVV